MKPDVGPAVPSAFAGVRPSDGAEFRAFLDFPLAGIPLNAIISSATLDIVSTASRYNPPVPPSLSGSNWYHSRRRFCRPTSIGRRSRPWQRRQPYPRYRSPTCIGRCDSSFADSTGQGVPECPHPGGFWFRRPGAPQNRRHHQRDCAFAEGRLFLVPVTTALQRGEFQRKYRLTSSL